MKNTNKRTLYQHWRNVFPSNPRRLSNAGLMLGHSLRRWPNIKPKNLLGCDKETHHVHQTQRGLKVATVQINP